MQHSFNDKDSENLVEFLNLIANKAEFNNMSLKEIIRFYGLLNWAQQSLLEKIKNNVIEVIRTRELKPEETKSKGKK